MRMSGTAWYSGNSVEHAMSNARSHYGRGYRVTFIRSKPDPVLAASVLALYRWEIVDIDAVNEEYRERNAPMTGLQRQAIAYLSDPDY